MSGIVDGSKRGGALKWFAAGAVILFFICEKTVSPLIGRASEARGYKYKYVAADILDKPDEALLKCYLPPGYISVPQLICPANGITRILTSEGTFKQIISYSQKCLEAAYA